MRCERRTERAGRGVPFGVCLLSGTFVLSSWNNVLSCREMYVSSAEMGDAEARYREFMRAGTISSGLAPDRVTRQWRNLPDAVVRVLRENELPRYKRIYVNGADEEVEKARFEEMHRGSGVLPCFVLREYDMMTKGQMYFTQYRGKVCPMMIIGSMPDMGVILNQSGHVQEHIPLKSFHVVDYGCFQFVNRQRPMQVDADSAQERELVAQLLTWRDVLTSDGAEAPTYGALQVDTNTGCCVTMDQAAPRVKVDNKNKMYITDTQTREKVPYTFGWERVAEYNVDKTGTGVIRIGRTFEIPVHKFEPQMSALRKIIAQPQVTINSRAPSLGVTSPAHVPTATSWNRLRGIRIRGRREQEAMPEELQSLRNNSDTSERYVTTLV